MRAFKKEVRLISLSLIIILILVAFVGCARNKKDDSFMSDSDFSQRVSDTINAYLDKTGEKIALNSGVGGWEILGSQLKDVLDKENIDTKNLDEYKEKMLYATIFAVEKKDKSTIDTLFVTDETGKEVLLSLDLKDGLTSKIFNALNK